MNTFFNYTFKYNNFSESESEAIYYLNILLNKNMLNNSCYNNINYEKLIYIEVNYKDNVEIQFLLNKIKQQIAENWLKKQQILNRLK